MSTRQSSIRSNGALSLSGDRRFPKGVTCLLKSVSRVASKTVDVLFSETESQGIPRPRGIAGAAKFIDQTGRLQADFNIGAVL